MAFFREAGAVLGGLDRDGRIAHGHDWDQQVAAAILRLNASYGNRNLLNTNRKLIDYGDLATQAAYVFMYVAGHADFLHSVFRKGYEIDAFDNLKKDVINVTSIGGGPGSDLLALVRLIRAIPAEVRPQIVRYRVLDKQPNWHEILQTVALAQKGTFDIELTFESFDVTVPRQWENRNCSTDDLLIMNFFVSEVCRLREADSVRNCLEYFLRSLPVGAMVVFNDSSFVSCYEYFDSRVKAAGQFSKTISESQRLDADSNFDEFFRDCMARFDRTPKLGSNAAFRILKKL